MSLLDNLMGALGGQGDLAETVKSLGVTGGVGGLVDAFQKGGLSEVAQSWVSSDQNLPVSPEQIQAVLGSGVVGQFAEKLGVDPQTAAAKLSEILPGLVDKLTPGGKLPDEGLGGAVGDLLGGFLKS
ncbi:YidB family protein [Caulobacter sp. CCNWLY153]|uniref:YidB family protein n=1 Tax=unclassified Caulobacter TaxID=2648921 RepID=UPI002FEF5CB3